MRILLWHVHGSWTNNFVQGGHEYFLPHDPERTALGIGLGHPGRTWGWPENVQEVAASQLPNFEFDVAILQRQEEIRLVEAWTGRRPGRDFRAIYLEHNTPGGNVPYTKHPLAHQRDIPLVHVTHFNQLIWDNGVAETTVITDGVVDPGHRYTGELPRIGVAINGPLRRGRAVGADLVQDFADLAPVDLFGLQSDLMVPLYDVPDGQVVSHNLSQAELHAEMAKRRVYLHPYRWNAIGLSLMEAMLLGMPVVTLAIGEVPHVCDSDAIVSSLSIEKLRECTRNLLHDNDMATHYSRRAREAALKAFSLQDFLRRWDAYLSA